MASSEVSINQLPVVNQVVDGDFLIVQTPNATNRLNFSDFVVGLANTSFSTTIAQNTTNITALSSESPACMQRILKSHGTVTGAGNTIVDVAVGAQALQANITLTRPDSYIKISSGITFSVADAHQIGVTYRISPDNGTYTELGTYINSNPGSNVPGVYVLGPDTDSAQNVGYAMNSILYKPGLAELGTDNIFYAKVGIRCQTSDTVYINRGSASGNAQKAAGTSFIMLEEVYNSGSQSVVIN